MGDGGYGGGRREKKEITQMEELEELIEVRLVGRWATGGTVVVEGRRRRSS